MNPIDRAITFAYNCRAGINNRGLGTVEILSIGEAFLIQPPIYYVALRVANGLLDDVSDMAQLHGGELLPSPIFPDPEIRAVVERSPTKIVDYKFS